MITSDSISEIHMIVLNPKGNLRVAIGGLHVAVIEELFDSCKCLP